MKQTPVQFLTRSALLLALMLVVQIAKNLSPWITGPLVNAILVLATLGVGLASGIALSIIAPVSALLIAQQPLMALTNYTLIPVIMLGNIILVLAVYIFTQKNHYADAPLALGLIVGSVIKWLVMWALVAWVITPSFSAALAPQMVTAMNYTYSVVQIGTAIIGSLLAFFVWIPLQKALNR